jgi:hypothetical protein
MVGNDFVVLATHQGRHPQIGSRLSCDPSPRTRSALARSAPERSLGVFIAPELRRGRSAVG